MKKEKHTISVVKTLFILLIVLIGVTSFSPATASIIVEKNPNEKKIINSEGFHWRVYCIGKIYNLSIENKSYNFESSNLRYLEMFKSDSGTWKIEYIHYKASYQFYLLGFHFRGILIPSFICGVFYGG